MVSGVNPTSMELTMGLRFDEARYFEPVPCKGALGFWRLPDDVERAVVEQLGERAA